MTSHRAVTEYLVRLGSKHLMRIHPVVWAYLGTALGSSYYGWFVADTAERHTNMLVLLCLVLWDLCCWSSWLRTLSLCILLQLSYRILCTLYYGLWIAHFCVLRECIYEHDVFGPEAYAVFHSLNLFLGQRLSIMDEWGETRRLLYCHPSMIIVEYNHAEGQHIISYHPTFHTRWIRFHNRDFIYERMDQTGHHTQVIKAALAPDGVYERQLMSLPHPTRGTTLYLFKEQSDGLTFQIRGPTRGAYPILQNHVTAKDYRHAQKRFRKLITLQNQFHLFTHLWDLVLDYYLFLPEMPYPRSTSVEHTTGAMERANDHVLN